MKRHLKPYRCTFSICNKRFGSKNDWKRHENSQHYQLELWKCNERYAGGTELCGKAFDRSEQLKVHLSKDHNIKNPVTVEDKLQDCLDDRKYEVSFWCGFCREIVKVKKGLKTRMWVGRSDHVDDHLKGQNGRKMDFCDWQDPDPSVSEVAFTLIGYEDAGQHDSFGTLSASSAVAGYAGRPPKRSADEDAPQSKLPKRARQNGFWYCVGASVLLSYCMTWLTKFAPLVRLPRGVQHGFQ